VAVLLPKSTRVDLARSIRRDIVNNSDYYHLALAKTTAWADEASPDTLADSVSDLNQFRRDIICVQRINSEDVCHLAARINWVSGTVYDSYDDSYSTAMPSYSEATTLSNANFYVITDEFKVYKCLDNNSNVASTSKPIATGTSAFTLTDGYVWKFLFQISAADQTKFLDTQYIPVRKLTGNPLYDVNGEIDSINVTAGGSGYTTASVNIAGDGDGTASATATISAGVITSIAINSAGSGYSFARATITGDGTGATATVTLGDTDIAPTLQSNVEATAVKGTIDRIEILTSGSGYLGDDIVVVVTGDGSGAEATATVDASTGQLLTISVTNAGNGYSFADITFTSISGAGTSATARAIVSPINGHGSHVVNELFANTLAVVVSLSDNTNADLFLNNDFRQVGLIKNVYPYGSSVAPYTGTTGTSCFIIDVADGSKYNADDMITTSSDGSFRVIQKTSVGSTSQIYLQPLIGLISGSSILTNTTTGVGSLSINSVIANTPEIDVKTGEIVYVESRPAINRQDSQAETIKAILTF
jgi:hypothetical protein